jgi:hypothetical protein
MCQYKIDVCPSCNASTGIVNVDQCELWISKQLDDYMANFTTVTMTSPPLSKVRSEIWIVNKLMDRLKISRAVQAEKRQGFSLHPTAARPLVASGTLASCRAWRKYRQNGNLNSPMSWRQC